LKSGAAAKKLKINSREIFRVVRFSTFATKSAISDHSHRSKLQLYSTPTTTGAIDRARGAPQGVKN
jgi:hypothetical protein